MGAQIGTNFGGKFLRGAKVEEKGPCDADFVHKLPCFSLFEARKKSYFFTKNKLVFFY